MTVNTAQIKDLLLPGLNAIFGDYDEIPNQWQELFSKNTSDMYREVDVEVKLLGLAQLRSEGQAVNYDDMGERYQYVYVHRGVGLGFVITKFAIRDNLYKSQFGPNTRALKFSFRQTKEIYGAAVFNNANDATGTYFGGDGVALLSTSHPIDVGTVANTPTVQAELNESSLQDAIVGVRRFKNAAGLRVLVRGKKVVVPPELQFTAERLFATTLRVGTADNDVSAFKSRGDIVGGYTVNDFLTNTKGWYLLTDCPDGLKYFQRDPLEIDMYTDFDTDNLKVKGTERFSFGWSNFRAVYGNMP
jgi:hypothetical protein